MKSCADSAFVIAVSLKDRGMLKNLIEVSGNDGDELDDLGSNFGALLKFSEMLVLFKDFFTLSG